MPQAFTTNPHLILPVSKYSFSLESNGVTKFSWKHAHNAFLIFDSFRSKLDLPSTQSSKCLKVVKGTDTLVANTLRIFSSLQMNLTSSRNRNLLILKIKQDRHQKPLKGQRFSKAH